MTITNDFHDVLIAKMESRAPLDEEDRTAIRELTCTSRIIATQSYLTREGERPLHCAFLVDGFAYRHKLTSDGARQIVGIMMPGDFTDLQQLFLIEADHNVQALTRLEIADIAIPQLQALVLTRPNISRALWVDALVEGSMTREAVLNIGRRDGAARIAHLLCEFETRLAAAGLADRGYELPMSQEQIGDATGMTSVHVNRTVKQLEKEGLIARSGRNNRSLRITDWRGLQVRADFNPRYLHLDQNSAMRIARR